LSVPSSAPVAPPDPDTPTPVPGTLHSVRGAAIFEDLEMQILWDRAAPPTRQFTVVTGRFPTI
ncbi:hypothetical protein E4U23_001926, partial [Claviceps purpurea]